MELMVQLEAYLNDSMRMLSAGHFDLAKHNLEILKDILKEDHRVYFGLLLASRQCRNAGELIAQAVPVDKEPEFRRACSCGDEAAVRYYCDLSARIRFAIHERCIVFLREGKDSRYLARIWMERYLECAPPKDPFARMYRVLLEKGEDPEILCGALMYLEKLSNGKCQTRQPDISDWFISLMDTCKATFENSYQQPGGTTPLSGLKQLKNPVRSYGVSLCPSYADRRILQLSLNRGGYVCAGTYYVPGAVEEARCKALQARIDHWCAPSEKFCREAGIDPIPLTSQMVKTGEPTDKAMRYLYLCRRLTDPKRFTNLRLCYWSFRKLAPERLSEAADVTEAYLTALAEKEELTEYMQREMEEIAPEDYRLYYIRIRMKTQNLKTQERFDEAYSMLQSALKGRKNRDLDMAVSLDGQYSDLLARMDARIRPLTEIHENEGKKLRAMVPEQHRWMIEKWDSYYGEYASHIAQIRKMITLDRESLAPDLEKYRKKQNRKENGLFGGLFGRRGSK